MAAHPDGERPNNWTSLRNGLRAAFSPIDRIPNSGLGSRSGARKHGLALIVDVWQHFSNSVGCGMASFPPTGTAEPDLDIASRPALTEPTNESSESHTLSSVPCRKSQDPDNSWSLLDLKTYLKEQGGRLYVGKEVGACEKAKLTAETQERETF